MPQIRKCCIINCNSFKLQNTSFHYFPSNSDLNLKWRKVLTNYTDIENLSEHSLVCSQHFTDNSFKQTTKRRQLIPEAIPCLFEHRKEVPVVSRTIENALNFDTCIANTQTKISFREIQDLYYTKQCLAQKCRRLQIQNNRLKQRLNLEKEKQMQNLESQNLQKIKLDAEKMNPRAIFILDQIKNYSKKHTRWLLY